MVLLYILKKNRELDEINTKIIFPCNDILDYELTS